MTDFGGRRAGSRCRPIRGFLTALSCIAALASPALAQRFGAESFTLANGLQVVVVPNRLVNIVTRA